jgi:3-oxo-5-alpha-steroid 4-dehydrogenase 1
MSIFQFINSSNIACWLVYSTLTADLSERSILSFGSLVGLALFFLGIYGNIRAEGELFELRRGAAKRKAKSEGKAEVTYDKVYVIPPAEGLFRYVLFPHYSLEWLEWTGFWILGGSWGLGWGYQSPALWFLINELATMLPRAVTGVQWYDKKFGKRAVAGRSGAIPGII